MLKTKSDAWWDSEPFSPLDKALAAVNQLFFVDYPALTLCVSIGIYVLIVLGFGPFLGISANYFVLIPVLSFSLVFGFPGGLVAGACALPANLMLFMILGHTDFGPASKTIAELSGIFVGASFGFLSDYFKKLMREMDRRVALEGELRRNVAEKDILLRELQHRVKNNLNLIKSLIQLQRNRSDDFSFKEASGLLLNRVYTVSLAHDLLFIGDSVLSQSNEEWIDIEKYFRAITENVSILYPESPITILVTVNPVKCHVDKIIALNLGLILNELVVNAVKHAFEHVSDPHLEVSLFLDQKEGILVVADNGNGCPAIDSAPAESKKNLGLTLIGAIVGRLDGRATWKSGNGLRFELVFPYVIDKQKSVSAK
ncbi:MAG: sensor histidine kinase [Treponemataceae bacterium]